MPSPPPVSDADDHYYVAGYSVDDDPYAEPSGVLKNLYGIAATGELSQVEGELAAVRTLVFLESPVAGQFDLAHLQAIHHFLFQDIYGWAGKIRTVGIGKNDTQFKMPEEIIPLANALFQWLADNHYFRGLDHSQFAQKSGELLGRLNIIHPFREGNGRAQRMFMTLIARNAGYDINWSGCSKEAMKNACIEAGAGNFKKLTKIILIGLDPWDEN